MDPLEQLSQLDKFFVQQKFAPIVNKYRISTCGPDGESEGEPLLFVQQKRMRVKEQIDIYSDEARKNPVMQLKKRNVFEFKGKTDVTLADGTSIGVLQKAFKKSLVRSSWEIRSADGETLLATSQESSVALAVLRRLWGFIPVLNNVPFFIPFHFDVHGPNGERLGRYQRIAAIRDRYVMDLSADTERTLDRRVMGAFAIALDALQDR